MGSDARSVSMHRAVWTKHCTCHTWARVSILHWMRIKHNMVEIHLFQPSQHSIWKSGMCMHLTPIVPNRVKTHDLQSWEQQLPVCTHQLYIPHTIMSEATLPDYFVWWWSPSMLVTVFNLIMIHCNYVLPHRGGSVQVKWAIVIHPAVKAIVRTTTAVQCAPHAATTKYSQNILNPIWSQSCTHNIQMHSSVLWIQPM